MKGKLIFGVSLAALLASAGVALATFQGSVLYKPPLLKFTDFSSHNSQEDVIVRREGSDLTITSFPAPPNIDPASDPGCESISGGVSCPRQGVEKLLVLLGGAVDSADIDLGASADKVKQVIKGQADGDVLNGGDGTQKLKGGKGSDELMGGPGKDILIGGPGQDSCQRRPGERHHRELRADPAALDAQRSFVATLRRPMTFGTRNLALLLLLPRWGS